MKEIRPYYEDLVAEFFPESDRLVDARAIPEACAVEPRTTNFALNRNGLFRLIAFQEREQKLHRARAHFFLGLTNGGERRPAGRA